MAHREHTREAPGRGPGIEPRCQWGMGADTGWIYAQYTRGPLRREGAEGHTRASHCPTPPRDFPRSEFTNICADAPTRWDNPSASASRGSLWVPNSGIYNITLCSPGSLNHTEPSDFTADCLRHILDRVNLLGPCRRKCVRFFYDIGNGHFLV